MLLPILTFAFVLQACSDSRANALSLTEPFRTGMATRRGKRIYMEDRAGAWTVGCSAQRHAERRYSVWAVFDGHGSAAVSSYLEAALHLYLQRRLCEVPSDESATDIGENRLNRRCGCGDCQHVHLSLLRAFEDLDADMQQQQQQQEPQGQEEEHPQLQEGQLLGGLNNVGAELPWATEDCVKTSSAQKHMDPGTGRVWRDSPDADRLEALRAAAAEAAWDCGSTAVVAVAEWTVNGPPCDGGRERNGSGAAGAAAPGSRSPATLAMTPADDDREPRECLTTTSHNDTRACVSGTGDGGSGGFGQLWIATLGNSPAILCVSSAYKGVAQSSGRSGDDDDGRDGGAVGCERGATGQHRARAAQSVSPDGSDGARGGGNKHGMLAHLLTVSHDMQNEEELRRIAAAGGRVERPSSPGGTRRLMGDLEVSRAFGDLQYRNVGLSAKPDIVGPWLLRDGSSDCDIGSKAARSYGPAGCVQAAVAGQISNGEDGSVPMECRAMQMDLPRQVSAYLLLASDGILEAMTPQDMCDHANAQLTGLAEPSLASPPPPAIALGPVTSKQKSREAPPSLPASLRSESSQTQSGGSSQLQPQAATAAASYVKDGQPKCCDCELRPAALDSDEIKNPCTAETLRRPFHRRPERRTVQDVATRLVQEALNRGSMDNLAAVVVQLPVLSAPPPDLDGGETAASQALPPHSPAAALTELPAPGVEARTPIVPATAAVAVAAAAVSHSVYAPVVAVESVASRAQSGFSSRGDADGLGGGDKAWGENLEGGEGPAVSRQIATWVTKEVPLATAAATVTVQTRKALLPGERSLLSVQARCKAIPAVSLPSPLLVVRALESSSASKWDRMKRGHNPWNMLKSLHAIAASYRRQLLTWLRARFGIPSGPAAAQRHDAGSKTVAGSRDGWREVVAPYHAGQSNGDSEAVVALLCTESTRSSRSGAHAPLATSGSGGLAMATTATAAASSSAGFCEARDNRQRAGFVADASESAQFGGGEDAFDDRWEEVVQASYGYVLAERIAPLPSAPDHLHASLPGGEALQPWRRGDFDDGAATFVIPGFGGGAASTGTLLDWLQLYPSTGPHDATPGAGTAVVPDTGVHLHGSDCEAPTEEVCSDGNSSSSSSSSSCHALMSFGSTHSLLLEIAAVPLQSAPLFGGSDMDPGPTAPEGGRGSRPGAGTPTTYNIGSGGDVGYEDVAPARNQPHGLPDNHALPSDVGGAPFGPLPEDSPRTRGASSTGESVSVWQRPIRPVQSSGGRENTLPSYADAGLQGVMTTTTQPSPIPADPGNGAGSSLGVPWHRGRTLMFADSGEVLQGESGDNSDGGVEVTNLPAATATSSAVGHSPAIAGGPQLRFQPRAHGVRLADGALHLVTEELSTAAAASSSASVASSAGPVTRGAAGGNGYGASGWSIGKGGDGEALPHAYKLRERFGQGHFGEVWRAWRLDRFPLQDETTDDGAGGSEQGGRTSRRSSSSHQQPAGAREASEGSPAAKAAAAAVAHGPPGFVLKRLRGSSGPDVLLSGLREAYFGDVLGRLGSLATVGAPGEEASEQWRSDRGHGHLVDFLESFEVVSEASEGAVKPPDAAQGENGRGPCDGDHTAGIGATCGGHDHDHDHDGDGDDDDGCGDDGNGDCGGGGSASESAQSPRSPPPPPPDLWLVFRDAGKSLHDQIYSPIGQHSVGEDEEPSAAADGSDRQQATGPTFQVLGPSPWWHAIRRHPCGNEFVRQLLRQLLVGLQAVHEANITHRDIKPENMMLAPMKHGSLKPGTTRSHVDGAAARSEGTGMDGAADAVSCDVVYGGATATSRHKPAANAKAPGKNAQPPRAPSPPSTWQWLGGTTFGAGAGGEEAEEQADDGGGAAAVGSETDGAVAPVWLRLIDFGSAVDDYSLQHLYGGEGPTSDQLTLEYAPPEALFGRFWEGMKAMRPRAWAYDIWSVGVVWLELLMATPQVWQLPAATRALLEARLALRGRPESERQLVFLLRGLMEWCIYPPQAPSVHSGPPLRGRKSRLLMSWSCTEEALLNLAKSRDPLGLGLEGPMALRLLLRLLHWDPASRPSARQALQHAFFTVKPGAWATFSCGETAVGEPGWC
ncbi:hypothetical protein Vafri_6764 [Volvox africanus]|uniref:Protein-serine/threonine phosphatase n=1 Tax=Volvox africanus TaxID=51714 RepID=A0A8J4EX45_9CHLO|nr:hypothetical protein Vafri_6764 [Volvox africanus]